jgi:acetylglutamate kinase
VSLPGAIAPPTSPRAGGPTRPTVLKLGGELLEAPDRLRALARGLAALALEGPLAVVHGGGREIDADLARRGLSRIAVDGVRVTDAPTLDAVVAVLAGTVNTRLVAALVAQHLRAVGLTGADAASVPVTKAPPHLAVSGAVVDLGLVGDPLPGDAPRLIVDLLLLGYVPVIATLGLGAMGQLYNVNADTLAASLACRLGARRLLVAGSTPGVVGHDGRPLAMIDADMVAALVRNGTATHGMVAKLAACRAAIEGGVEDVRIIDARDGHRLSDAPGTRLVGASPATPGPSHRRPSAAPSCDAATEHP